MSKDKNLLIRTAQMYFVPLNAWEPIRTILSPVGLPGSGIMVPLETAAQAANIYVVAIHRVYQR